MNYYNNMYGMQMQPSINRIDRQIEDLQNLKTQMQTQPQMNNNPTPAINQTFQLANSNNMNDFDGKYATNIDDVKNNSHTKMIVFTYACIAFLIGLFLNHDILELHDPLPLHIRKIMFNR